MSLDKLTYFYDLSLSDRILFILILAIAVLFTLSILFAIMTVTLRIGNNLKERKLDRLESIWREMILEVITGSLPPSSVWEKIDKKEELIFVNYVLKFARRLKGDERKILSEIVQPYLPKIASRIDYKSPERRARAVQTLGILGLERYSEDLLEAMDDPSPIVAMIAARSLCSPDHPEHTTNILEKLDRFSQWSMGFLASMLASIGSGAGPALRKAYEDRKKTPFVRAVCGEALLRFRDLEAGDLAANILKIESDDELLSVSLKILTKVGRPEHLDSIRAIVDSDNSAVRMNALEALGAIGEQEDVSILTDAFNDTLPWVAIKAANGLVSLGATDYLKSVIESHHINAEIALEVLTN